MTEFSAADIDHLADLSRLNLSDVEKEQFATQLPKIIEFVEQLQEVNTDDIADAGIVVPLQDMRVDEDNSEHLSLEQLQALAPQWRGGHIEVPAVFGEVNE